MNPYDIYSGGDQQQQQQQHWESLHSPLDTTTPPIPTPPTPFQHHHLQPSPIDNAPILLHHPHENPPHQPRHSLTPTGPVHPIDALIFRSLPGSASSTPAPGPASASSSVIRNPSSSSRARAHPYMQPEQRQQTRASPSTSFMVPTPSHPQAETGRPQVTTRSRSKKQQQIVKFSTTAHCGMVERPTTRSQAQASAAAVASSSTTTHGLLGQSATVYDRTIF